MASESVGNATELAERADRPEGETESEGLLLGPDEDRTPALSIVLPTLNEEEGVSTCITKIKRSLAEIGETGEIIVSDSSSDRTPDIAREMGAIVVEPDRPGYGYAYRYAFERARGEYIVMGDADTTYDFEELPKLLELVAEDDADIAMGSRLEGEIKPGAMPNLHQYVGNPMLTRFLNTFYDAGVTDGHSGFRVLTRDALETLELNSDGMEFASEMIMDAGAKGLTIEEVPITYHEREGEATLNSFQDGWRHMKFMLTNAPWYLFSLPGLFISGVGVLAMVASLLNIPAMGVVPGVHTLIAGSLLTMVGYQVGTLWLFSILTTDPIRRQSDTARQWLQEHFDLRRVAGIGVALILVGGSIGGYMIWNWVQSGFAELPLISADIVAMTCIVLGIQTIFNAVFASTLLARY